MKGTQADFESILSKLKDVRVVVLGDLVLDRYIWGRVDRISPEAPVPIVHMNRIEDRLGCAGNAVANLSQLGTEVRLFSVVGDDEEGRAVQRLLSARSISEKNIFIDPAIPTIVKTRVIAHSQQVVRIDRETVAPSPVVLDPTFLERLKESLDWADVLIVSDYGKGTITGELLEKIWAFRKKQPQPTLFIVDPHPRNFEHYQEITLAKPNRSEAAHASGIQIEGRDGVERAARRLLERWKADSMLITLGEDGLALFTGDNEKGVFIETVAREVYDVSGAGDTVTAVFSAAAATGAQFEIAGELANIAAGIVVSEVGTVPIAFDRLADGVKRVFREQK